MGDRKPRAPAGLGATGKRLWRSVTGELELRSDERAVLDAACRMADELAVIEAALAEAPATVVGSMGQPKAHPLFAEARQHRAELRRLLGSFRVEDAGSVQDVVFPSGMSNVQRSARMRWQAHRVQQQARKMEASDGA